MIDKHEYKILKRFRDTPRKFYEESKLPKSISSADLAELIDAGLLERFTLDPRREDQPYRQAVCGIRITRPGRLELLLFGKERSDKVWQVFQFLSSTFLAIAALPGAVDTIRQWFR